MAKHLANDPATAQAISAIQEAQEPDETTVALANFRQAVEFQQFMSEVLNHVQQSMVQIPEDHPVYEDAVENCKPEAERVYFRARQRVMETGMRAATLLNPEHETSSIIIPEVTP